LEGLLQKNPKKRLGYNGPNEVKKHPWFEKTNWAALLIRAIKAPFVPILNSEVDISNFDVEFTSTEIESCTEGESLTEQPNYFGN
jgi:serum/glucocorticoid-regulated kinase 2